MKRINQIVFESLDLVRYVLKNTIFKGKNQNICKNAKNKIIKVKSFFSKFDNHDLSILDSLTFIKIKLMVARYLLKGAKIVNIKYNGFFKTFITSYIFSKARERKTSVVFTKMTDFCSF